MSRTYRIKAVNSPSVKTHGFETDFASTINGQGGFSGDQGGTLVLDDQPTPTPEGGDALPLTHASFFSGVGGVQQPTLGLSVPDGAPSPSPRSTPTPAPSSPSGGPASPTSGASSGSPIAFPVTYSGFQNVPTDGVTDSLRTENVLAVMTGEPPPSGQADSRARTSPSPGSGGDLAYALRSNGGALRPEWDTLINGERPAPPAEPAPASPSPSSISWLSIDPEQSSSRTFRAFSPVMEGETWQRSSVRWSTSGTAWRTGCSTHVTSECPSADGESSSSVCEAVPTTLTDVLQPSAPPRFSLSARAAAGILRRASKRGRALPPELEKALTELAQMAPPPLGPSEPGWAGMATATRLRTSMEDGSKSAKSVGRSPSNLDWEMEGTKSSLSVPSAPEDTVIPVSDGTAMRSASSSVRRLTPVEPCLHGCDHNDPTYCEQCAEEEG